MHADARRPHPDDGQTQQGPINIPADYIIDATGLEADITEHRLLKDLFDMTGAQRNPYGKMQVELSFEVTGHA